MGIKASHVRRLLGGSVLLLAAVLAAGCAGQSVAPTATATTDNASEILVLPELQAVALDDRPLQVVATTSIVGDVVAQVGGDEIVLVTLMDAGSDPHSYQPAPRDLAAVAEADVIFVNGWDLEETLVDHLQAVAQSVPIVPVSANIQPLHFDEDDGHGGEHAADPHVWLAVDNVKQWVQNIDRILSALDPNGADAYHRNATAYGAELDRLEQEITLALAAIPAEKRFLVTNHDSLAYFAEAYGFTVVGTVIPGGSTLAEPSASDLADLVSVMNEYGVCAIIAETTTSSTLAETVAGELAGCEEVEIVPLYTGALGPPSSGADSYVSMMDANIQRIGEALSEQQ